MPPAFTELMESIRNWDGWAPVGTDVIHTPEYERKITEVTDLVYNTGGIAPHRREFMIREALTTSDFPLLFADVLDRQVLASYKAAPSVFRKFMRIGTAPDFRAVSRFQLSGGNDALERVGEKGEYPASSRAEARYYYNVNKYGRQFDISWESIINDDLDALKDTPRRFADAALRTEQRFAGGLYMHDVVTATGARGNLSANPLTINNLETGLEWFAAQVDAGGEAILNRAKYLAVPPALEMTARQIMSSAVKHWLAGATTIAAAPDVSYPMKNVVADYGLELVIDPYITILNVANATPLTAVGGWYLFSDPKDIAAYEMGFLRGHEKPEVCMKSSDKVTVGGGLISPMSGDFATDNIFYRVRHVLGGVALDYRGFYFGGHLD